MTDSYPIVKLLILIAVLFYSGHRKFKCRVLWHFQFFFYILVICVSQISLYRQVLGYSKSLCALVVREIYYNS